MKERVSKRILGFTSYIVGLSMAVTAGFAFYNVDSMIILAVLYMVDMIGLVATLFWITDLKEGLSIYILGVTAISLTVTVAVKLYNLFSSNANNKKL